MRRRTPNGELEATEPPSVAGPPLLPAPDAEEPRRDAARGPRSALRDRGVVNVRPKLAAEMLGTSELQLRRYRKQHPDRLRVVRQGVRAIAYPLDDIERMARDGWTLD